LKIYNMTHYEDVKRVASNETIDFLNARIEALENRVRYLESILEVEYLNKQQ
tara:strand:- start:1250 stop:1405 length:156 start_codon:yes stop_codon:yes gene_type:complete